MSTGLSRARIQLHRMGRSRRHEIVPAGMDHPCSCNRRAVVLAVHPAGHVFGQQKPCAFLVVPLGHGVVDPSHRCSGTLYVWPAGQTHRQRESGSGENTRCPGGQGSQTQSPRPKFDSIARTRFWRRCAATLLRGSSIPVRPGMGGLRMCTEYLWIRYAGMRSFACGRSRTVARLRA